MGFYFKENILVKVEVETKYTDAPYIYKYGDFFSFIEEGAYTPEKIEAAIQEKKLPFTHQKMDISATHTRRFYFIGYEPAELLIGLHNRTIEDVDYKLKPRTTVISVSTNGIDNSDHRQFISFDTRLEMIEFPKNYNTFSDYLANRDKIATLETQIAALPILAPQNSILDLRNGVCVEGCEYGDETSVIHYGNYLYKGKLKNGVPHDEDGTSILYKLQTNDINKIRKFVAYKFSEKINCVIINGAAFLQFIDFDINTGVAITQPYNHPILKKEVYAQVQIIEDSKIDTNFAFLCTTKDCHQQDKVYVGAINLDFEANGIGDFKLTTDENEYIIRTHWKNNFPNRKKINREGINGNEKITSVISQNGTLVENNIVDLTIDTSENKLLLSSMELTKTKYEESIMTNPNAKPTDRLIGCFGFNKNRTILCGTHIIQKYRGIGDVNDDNNWETTKTCQLSSFDSKRSCFISGDNFYDLKNCTIENSKPLDNYSIFPLFGF